MLSPLLLILFLFFFLSNSNPNPNPGALASDSSLPFSILNFPDYGYPPPPPPPPPPPDGPSISCSDGLAGSGSFDTICVLNSSVSLSGDVYIKGTGSLSILPDVVFSCPVPGCTVVARLGGEIRLGAKSALVAGSFMLAAGNMSVAVGAAVDVTGLGGDPPDQTSGVGTGIHGDGGGHGGRGASCYVKEGDTQEDSWGGDVYAWPTLTKPVDYGSKGGTTSLEKDYGGGGGGRVLLEVKDVLEVDGVISADGGDGGLLGGGGSGGSIYISANRM